MKETQVARSATACLGAYPARIQRVPNPVVSVIRKKSSSHMYLYNLYRSYSRIANPRLGSAMQYGALL